MKIVQINSSFDKGGAGKIVKELHNYFESNNYESYVFFGRSGQSNKINVKKHATAIETYLHVAQTRIFGFNGYGSVFSTQKIVKDLKQIKPDIIHLHGLHGYYINFKILFNYINQNRVPIVWTFHDCHAFTGNCGYHYDCEKYTIECHKCPYLRDYPKTLYFDHTRTMFKNKKKLFTKGENKVIVSPSEWMTGDAKKSFFGKYKCITINNGINNNLIFYPRDKSSSRTKHGFSQNDKIVLGIAFGFDEPRKGVKYLVQLAKDLNSHGIKIVLIGLNSDQSKFVEGFSNITAIPFTSNQDELAEYYSLSDIFVLPSLAENYATVVIEAFACGTNVVGFDVGGVKEQLSDNRGIVVEVGNQDMLNSAIIDFFEGKIKLRNSYELVQYITKNNTVQIMAEKYIKVYNDITNNNGK